ncbi:hypothetical protein F4827_007081 [Paraburkholderia bannensis]|uniref:Uncharacterized protein n=1 Tax=Paraburkholderia bannensis TaxID=765414 RepID=A0A7W9U592_9BURK|nr:hypothetical protein [Paraburkholderia sp. WP4_3_2]MBB6107199.1 hypothetical protein [Paraburkholderia bannensis]
MRPNRMNADVLAESRRLAFDVSNATDDGMRNAPENGVLREMAGQQRSVARVRRQRKGPGRLGDLTNAAER